LERAPGSEVDLSSALEALRQELEASWLAGKDGRIRFNVSDVTLTVKVAARRDTTARGGLRPNAGTSGLRSPATLGP
jgi:hypothetical protein